MALDGSTIILGFTGSIGSGCTYISKMIPSASRNNYKYYKLSDIIRNKLKDEGNENPSVDEMQTKGNDLRKEFGNNVLVVDLIEALEDEEEEFNYIVIDGIKNDGEVNYLRQFPNFFLFSVNADRAIRKKRVVGSGKLFPEYEEFISADERDEFEANSSGQHVKKCNHESDIIIVNETQIPRTAVHKKKDYVISICRKYVELIENNVDGKISPEISPSINELCMTIAYSLCQKSSCLKRKVGAVIIEINEASGKKDASDGKVGEIPNIISSGYNEVPMGMYKCIFNKEYEKCYRDHLQEEHAKKNEILP